MKFHTITQNKCICFRIITHLVTLGKTRLKIAIGRDLYETFVDVEINALCIRRCRGERVEIVDLSRKPIYKAPAVRDLVRCCRA